MTQGSSAEHVGGPDGRGKPVNGLSNFRQSGGAGGSVGMGGKGTKPEVEV